MSLEPATGRRRRTPTLKSRIRNLQNKYLEEFLEEQGVHDWPTARLWLLDRIEAVYAINLPPRELYAAELLIELVVKYHSKRFATLQFRRGDIPLAAGISCALRYGTMKRFEEEVRTGCHSSYLRRDDLYLAWKLGIISDLEFQNAPPLAGSRVYEQDPKYWE